MGETSGGNKRENCEPVLGRVGFPANYTLLYSSHSLLSCFILLLGSRLI